MILRNEHRLYLHQSAANQEKGNNSKPFKGHKCTQDQKTLVSQEEDYQDATNHRTQERYKEVGKPGARGQVDTARARTAEDL